MTPPGDFKKGANIKDPFGTTTNVTGEKISKWDLINTRGDLSTDTLNI